MLKPMIGLMERGLIPEALLRIGIRNLCQQRLQSLARQSLDNPRSLDQYVDMLKASPVAVETKAANDQHYEVPADFFLKCLGPQRKYSCGYWPPGCESLETAEKLALEMTMQRAELIDGMKILELGCGWGSLTLAMARKFPSAQITAISNSNSQREFILGLAAKENLQNVDILTHDVAALEVIGDGQQKFDRVVSVEMFEHLRNYETILKRVRNWLALDGKLFVHIFTHRNFPYLFETEGDDNWMGRYFFTGGQMPSHHLFQYFQKDLKLEKEWQWDGTHYQKTSEAWLKNLEENKEELMPLLHEVYGPRESLIWYNRWRVFYLAVAELFGYRQGSEWIVSHYLFKT